jgi:outer membrane protein OmpA-like peptidoglycan-associated protein
VIARRITLGVSYCLALLVSALSSSAGCASASRKPCPSEAWTGECKLQALTKVEEREMPMPYVVYEAIYAPQANAEYPQSTPAELRLRFGARGVQELSLVDHLKRQQVVPCRAAAAPATCLPEEVTADVLPFDPAQAPSATAPSIVGCAAIDSASEQDRIARSQSEASPINERFTFGEGSSSLSPDATSSARDVAKRMADDPSLECLGVVGQTTPGEPVSLAEARARAVKQLLISLGVDSRRLLTIAANANVSGGGAAARPAVDPESRRVSLRVLLQTSAKPAP